jgi:hypothetical protein
MAEKKWMIMSYKRRSKEKETVYEEIEAARRDGAGEEERRI